VSSVIKTIVRTDWKT